MIQNHDKLSVRVWLLLCKFCYNIEQTFTSMTNMSTNKPLLLNKSFLPRLSSSVMFIRQYPRFPAIFVILISVIICGIYILQIFNYQTTSTSKYISGLMVLPNGACHHLRSNKTLVGTAFLHLKKFYYLEDCT